MPVIQEIQAKADTLIATFRDFHANPELGFGEHRTSRIVADLLRNFGVDEVVTGIGGTGVVGLSNLLSGNSERD